MDDVGHPAEIDEQELALRLAAVQGAEAKARPST